MARASQLMAWHTHTHTHTHTQVNIENAMMRYEFLEVIVRAGIAKYGKGIATDDVAEAVRMLLANNIAPNLPPGVCLAVGQWFCGVESVDSAQIFIFM